MKICNLSGGFALEILSALTTFMLQGCRSIFPGRRLAGNVPGPVMVVPAFAADCAATVFKMNAQQFFPVKVGKIFLLTINHDPCGRIK